MKEESATRRKGVLRQSQGEDLKCSGVRNSQEEEGPG